ncbi:MAG: aminotransferase class V-fold PLP-dependent enzyme [Oscillatoriales cyanobacterium RM2_1_1]|nr:aminotransferase class V-fold PLP-dependent enzyme [Oscillatoriales cyanobacterium SM2_3_0]NJO44464.1 aminotransferase class V-fold PLP-dependent enzyme [Oscillatoriales cyanobacterium RM2_1_1]
MSDFQPRRPIYLDYHSTTPVDPRVADCVYRFITEDFDNASSIDHEWGDRAEQAVKQAAKQVANLVGASPREIIWTSGATESINLAIQGSFTFPPHQPQCIALSPLEHKAVLDTCQALAKRGWVELVYLPVDSQGRLDLEYLEKVCCNGIALLCVMAANNELDQCGGHAGQGEDYHYHYAPICLMDDHNPELPIAFGLDGSPIYYGEGGDEYYGRGRYSGLSYLPDKALDECNALQLPDGGFVHFTTKTPPYVVGCHHGFFDSKLQIEPRPFDALAQRTASPLGGSYGEPVSTLITDFEEIEDGEYRLTFNSLTTSGVTSSILYRQTSEDCWVFEYQPVAGERGQTTKACRH